MSLASIIFSFNRPLQLWGLVKSMLDNTDLLPHQIICLCKSTCDTYKISYDVIGDELKCVIIHENEELTFFNQVYQEIAKFDYISFAVDDMVYFQSSSFAHGISVLDTNPSICTYSFRIGWDIQPHDLVDFRDTYWVAEHANTPMPYEFIFHTDGSLFRKDDLDYLLSIVPESNRAYANLNDIEDYIADYIESNRERLLIGQLHAGPPRQGCVTFQVNKVSYSGNDAYYELEATKPEQLNRLFMQGLRLNYQPLYNHFGWLLDLNSGWQSVPTHVAPTKDSTELFLSLIS